MTSSLAAAVGGVWLPLIIAYALTLVWIWDSWHLPNSYFAHGPVVVLGAVGLLWWRRSIWQSVPAGSARAGGWLVGAGLFVHLLGAALMIDSLSAASLVLTVPGAVWLTVGRRRLAAAGSILGLLAFAIPLPLFVTGRLVFQLKELAVGGALWLTECIGMGIVRDGARLSVPGQATPLEVADPCSGLNSLVALTTLGYCIAFFLGPQRGARRWILLLAAVPVAVVVNIIRIAAICVLARYQGVEFATRTGHDVLNLCAWGLDLGLLLGLDYLLSRRNQRVPEGEA